MPEIEEILRHELHDVASRVDVPRFTAPPRRRGRRQPLLAAAAVVLVLALGVLAALLSSRDGSRPQPAPGPTPTPSATASGPPTEVSTAPPKVPYLLDHRLRSGGEQVRHHWSFLSVHGSTWLAMDVDDDDNWYWGQGREWSLIALTPDAPSVSPDGRYVVALGTEEGHGIVWGQDTRPPGRGLGSAPVDLGDPADGSAAHVRAVTDQAQVVVQGTETSMLWLPEDGGRVVDLTRTAPGVTFLASTPAGLVVTDGDESAPFLADLSDDGVVSKRGDLPPLDSIAVAPGGRWMAWTPYGTLGGEVTSLGSLRAGTVDGAHALTLTAPPGWAFRVHEWTWEDDDDLVAGVVDGSGAERMARCSVLAQRCVLIPAP